MISFHGFTIARVTGRQPGEPGQDFGFGQSISQSFKPGVERLITGGGLVALYFHQILHYFNRLAILQIDLGKI